MIINEKEHSTSNKSTNFKSITGNTSLSSDRILPHKQKKRKIIILGKMGVGKKLKSFISAKNTKLKFFILIFF